MFLRSGCASVLAVCLGTATPLLAQTAVLHWTDVVRESGSARADLSLLRETADEMARVSPTFAHMLETVKAAPRLIVLARPAVLAGKLGQSRINVAARTTFVLMELNAYRLDVRLRVRAIAHELAHAVELACIPQTRDTRELAGELRAMAKSHSLPGNEATETAFPAALENAVFGEFQKRSATGSQLSRLAATNGLPGCGADGILSAGIGR